MEGAVCLKAAAPFNVDLTQEDLSSYCSIDGRGRPESQVPRTNPAG